MNAAKRTGNTQHFDEGIPVSEKQTGGNHNRKQRTGRAIARSHLDASCFLAD